MGLRGNTINISQPIDLEGYVTDPNTDYFKAMDMTQGVQTPTTAKVKIKKPGEEIFDPGANLSLGNIPEPKKPLSTPEAIEQEGLKNRQLVAIQAGAQFFADVFNANSAYAASSGEARLNILQARNQAADALYRGRQAQLEAESEGRQAGESALLAMAIQGQDVGGAAVQKIQGSYEAMGVFNGMREEINAVREALGYQLQEVAYNYQIRNADIARRSAIIGSAINFGASSIGTL